MKGIILAGGKGTRLDPLTIACNKQLLPVYDKPLIYYPLTTLLQGGIKNILIVTTPRDLPQFQRLLQDGAQWGISIKYAEEIEPRGIAAAFTIGAEFIGNDPVCLILGDNIFYSSEIGLVVEKASKLTHGAKIFGCYVKDPKRFGVVEFDGAGRVLSVEEKPVNPKSNYAVPGLYFYDNHVVDIAGNLKPSARGELEITDVNREYLADKKLQVELFRPGTTWLDAGTTDALLQASNFIYQLECCQGVKIGFPEEAAFRQGWITAAELTKLAHQLERTDYGRYLLRLVK